MTELERKSVSRENAKPSKEQETTKPSATQAKRPLIDDTYVCLPRFRNDIPDTPIGPFFRTFQPLHSFQEFAKFTISSLEKNYIWKPHIDTEVGLNVDLVDQDTVLLPFPNVQKPPLDPIDHRIINNQNLTAKGPLYDQDNKPWWLRSTTYLENNLFKSKNIKQEQRKLEHKEFLLEPFKVDYIRQSFEDVKHAQVDRKKKIEYSLPIFPSSHHELGITSQVRFFESYETLLPVEEEGDESSSRESCRKRFKRSILTNIRQLPIVPNKADQFSASLLVPDALASDEAEAEHFDWARDFRMDIREKNATSLFVFEIDEISRQCHYSRVHTRIDMHKLTAEDSEPCEATISRRTQVEDKEVEDKDDTGQAS